MALTVAQAQAALIAFMAAHGVSFRISLIPAGNPNRSGRKLVNFPPLNDIVHETANFDRGANAAMHEHFTHEEKGGDEHVSFTFVVDDHEIVQLLPLDEVGWQAADGLGPGNTNSWSHETCVNVDGDWTKTKHNVAVLVAGLESLQPALHIKQHHDIISSLYPTGKDCPHVMRLNQGQQWEALMNEIEQIASGGQPQPPTPNTEFVAETGHNLSNAFRTYWYEHNGIVFLGYPISEELYNVRLEDGQLWAIQRFERGVLQYKDPEGVLLVRTGALIDEKHLWAQLGLGA